MHKFKTAIIGAGAAGIVAAISAARKGCSVALCERMPLMGKKLLASGSGRCNLSNDTLDESYFNPTSRPLVRSAFSLFGKEQIQAFFRELGLYVYSDEGRIFPVTNQASTVLKALELQLQQLSVHLELDFEAAAVTRGNDGFVVRSKAGKKIESEKLIIAGGGRSYPALGSNGSCYDLARQFGHTIVEPVPSAVPLEVKDPLCHRLQGQKIFVRAKSIINGTIDAETTGELLFTKYGLSGTAILDISQGFSIALNRKLSTDAAVSVDFVPYLGHEALVLELERRLKNGVAPLDLLTGVTPNKFNAAHADLFATKDAAKIATFLKGRKFAVRATRGWNEAEFTAGGVDCSQVREKTLESTLRAGLYFCGEVLDVEGARGGYNLAWAWASGFVAGKTQ